MLEKITKQNYFQYNERFFQPDKGIAMPPPPHIQQNGKSKSQIYTGNLLKTMAREQRNIL
jgi:hypothetical protein